MKHDLWVINLWLILLLFFSFFLTFLLQKTPPPFRKKAHILEDELKRKKRPLINVAKICSKDLFDTIKKEQEEPIQKNLVTPIPELKKPSVTFKPDVKKPVFLPPITIKLNGTIVSDDDEKSVAMIADETNKENMYHLGEKIQDAQIIKIAHNYIVVLRSNGQQETYALREDKKITPYPEGKKWDLIIHKVDERSYEIDHEKFKHEYETLGEFVEALQLRTVYKQGKAFGVKIGYLDKKLESALGLQHHDIVLSINGTETADQRKRLSIYDSLTKLEFGDTVDVVLMRDNQELTLSYKLTFIEEPLKKMFISPSKAATASQASPKGSLQKSKSQSYEEKKRTFQNTHPAHHNQIIEDLRNRLLKNMNARSKHARVR